MPRKKKTAPAKPSSEYSKQQAKLHQLRVVELCNRLDTFDPNVLHSIVLAWGEVCKTLKRSATSIEKAIEKEERQSATHPWATFLGGHATRIKPRRIGWYLIADLEGNFRGVRYVDPDLRDLRIWAGWWWSQPIPGLPRPVQGVEV